MVLLHNVKVGVFLRVCKKCSSIGILILIELAIAMRELILHFIIWCSHLGNGLICL